MAAVILVIHLMIALSLVASVLLQRSEGGALGIGGGGGGFMTNRGAGNLLTRTTAILAFAFFTTSITLTLLATRGSDPVSIIDGVVSGQSAPAGDGVLPKLPTPAKTPSGPQAPISK